MNNNIQKYEQKKLYKCIQNGLVFDFLFYNLVNCERSVRALILVFTNAPLQTFRFFKPLPPHELSLGLVGLGFGLRLVDHGLGLGPRRVVTSLTSLFFIIIIDNS